MIGAVYSSLLGEKKDLCEDSQEAGRNILLSLLFSIGPSSAASPI